MSVETEYKEVDSPIHKVTVNRNVSSRTAVWNVGLLEARNDDLFLDVRRGRNHSDEASNGVMMSPDDAIDFFEQGIRFAQQLKDNA